MLSISTQELAQIQDDMVAAVCDQSCEIWRATTATPDGYGSETPEYTLIETTVAGLGQPSAGELANYDYKIGDKAAWTVRLPIDTDIGEQDHLVIAGQTLEVQVLLDPQSYQVILPVIAVEIK